MSSDAAIAAGRQAAEAQMTLTLAAYEPNGTTKSGGYDVPAFTAKGSTFGKIQGGSTAARDTRQRYVRIGDTERPVLEAGLHIPITAAVPVAGEQRGIGWEYVVTAIGPADDPALLDKRFLVVGVPVKSKATARRLDVVEL